MSEANDRIERTLARFDRVMTVIDEKQGPFASAARRERARKVAGYSRWLIRACVGFVAVCLAAIGVGLFVPIGMFGFLAAVGLGIACFMMIFFYGAVDTASAPSIPKDVDNGEMVQRFDSYLYKSRRALPRPAQQVIDTISADLGTLKSTLERVEAIDPDAQDARRLMSLHLPGLIERYANVPLAYRSGPDAEGVTVDQRLVEGLEAARIALNEVSERLAKRDVDAFQTQGRFIQSKYANDGK